MAHTATAGQIGPNAIIQTLGAVRALHGAERAEALCRQAGHSEYIAHTPTAMVDERDFNDLARALFQSYPREQAAAVLRRSGEQTGRYILQRRIPRPLALLLPRLPRRLALRVLLPAIRAHAWTFAGSGRFSFSLGRPTTLRLRGCVACRGIQAAQPICSYYVGAFETLLRALVDPRTQIHEHTCAAMGAQECVFAAYQGAEPCGSC